VTAAQITESGVYNMPADVYHSDPVPGGSLSSGGARKLLPPSCPALFRHWATNGQPPKAAFDFGHAAHLLVLGAGPPLAVVDADDWRTKNARAERDAAYRDGAVPILRADHDIVQAIATAIRAHPIARALFTPGAGEPEQSLFWVDDAAPGSTGYRSSHSWTAATAGWSSLTTRPRCQLHPTRSNGASTTTATTSRPRSTSQVSVRCSRTTPTRSSCSCSRRKRRRT
jgi:hypothetical protein